jgi:hypothetical protein
MASLAGESPNTFFHAEPTCVTIGPLTSGQTSARYDHLGKQPSAWLMRSFASCQLHK